MSTGADTKEKGGGALELLDLRLFEDGGERGSALGSDVVARNTASEGQDGNCERVGVSMGADRKGTLYRVAAHLRLEIIVSLRMAASAEAPLSLILLCPILQSMGKVGAVRG